MSTTDMDRARRTRNIPTNTVVILALNPRKSGQIANKGFMI